MEDSSLQESQNHDFQRLRSKASSLAATALAPTTNERYGQAWGRFMDICSKMGFNPFEASGPIVAA